jgi:hypothetical protein
VTVSLIVVGLLAIALLWLLFGGRDRPPEPTAHRRSGEAIDYTELEEAEREVQDAADEESVRDWGPGTRNPPVA